MSVDPKTMKMLRNLGQLEQWRANAVLRVLAGDAACAVYDSFVPPSLSTKENIAWRARVDNYLNSAEWRRAEARHRIRRIDGKIQAAWHQLLK